MTPLSVTSVALAFWQIMACYVMSSHGQIAFSTSVYAQGDVTGAAQKWTVHQLLHYVQPIAHYIQHVVILVSSAGSCDDK